MAVFTKGVVPWNSLDDNTRLPLTSELEGGYPCGQADQQLFNFTGGYAWGQVHNAIIDSGITPDLTDLTQLSSAIRMAAGRLIAIQTFTSSGLYVPTPGMTFCIVEGCGGGGGGSGGANPGVGQVSLGAPGGSATSGRARFSSSDIGSGKAVITYYPPNYTPNQPINYKENPYIYFVIKEINDPGIPRFSSGILPRAIKPINECGTFGIAGGSLFGHRSVFDTVPYDPNLYFFGEEPSYALRLYTHGIDIYAPTESYMYHYYNIMDRTNIRDRTLHWEDHNKKVNEFNQVAYLLLVGVSGKRSWTIGIPKECVGLDQEYLLS